MNPILKPRRAAFLLNVNAKSVTKSLLKKLSALIPKDDLYLSKSLSEAEECMASIVSKGYAYLFCGGGDGTAVTAINLMNLHEKMHPHTLLPKIGVLRLGTGNALARYLRAGSPNQDIKAILEGKSLKPVAVSMIETNAGQQTPFAGIGYDASS